MSQPRLVVTPHGPYRVEGSVAIDDAAGVRRSEEGVRYLCRCGGSRNKPFCDATHGLKGFDGVETASHDTARERREEYPADGVTVFDDRSRCAHFGQCTDRLARVFSSDTEPFVDVGAIAADPATAEGVRVVEVVDVVRGCPSGALSSALGTGTEPEEEAHPPSIQAIPDGPYRIRGSIDVVGADGRPYDRRERQTLCRCGQSRNKPFCDGSHWYAAFRDPLPPEWTDSVPTVYDWLGGLDALVALTTRFYADILTEPDPLLEPVFRGMDADHPRHVATWLAETFGGPRTYTTDHGGYEHMVAQHLNRRLTEEQRQRWVSRLVATADLVGLPDDPDSRAAFVGYLEWGSRIAVFNSQPGVEIIEHAPVPRWGWGNSAPHVPQPWDAPDAAQRGRERYSTPPSAPPAR